MFEEIFVAADDANAFDSIFDNATTTSDGEFVDFSLENSVDAINTDDTNENDQLDSFDERNSNMQRFVYSDDVVCFFHFPRRFSPSSWIRISNQV